MSDESDFAADSHDADGASGLTRLGAPADGAQQPRLPFPVVGVGASAGGLEAYTEFLEALPGDTGMAFVLVQHLSPSRESLVADILSQHTPMPVRRVEDGQAVEPDHVYVTRPGYTLAIRNGRLHLGESLESPGRRPPIDDFFRSLAEEQQQRAIGVILSGMGSNGTAGAQAIKAVGGMCIAQEPESANFPSMPRNLIDANLADYILKPSEMPEVLARYARHSYALADRSPEKVARREAQSLAEILGVLRTLTRHDFEGYRKPTVVRRVQRRMGLNQVEDMGDYARTLRQSTAEATALADDLLIHVTGFFRDPEAWDALRTKVIEPLVAGRADHAPVRAWVTACATGEEAYSLAIVLVEAAEAKGKRLDIKVFATDTAERALGHARAGVFAGGIESEVTPERLERFFDFDDVVYRVKRELRELVIFAPQNLLQDPPFSRLDIATCRNLLIYLEPPVQRRVISLLHFGLREGGALLLGSSESVGNTEDEFVPIDKKHRLFRRVGPTRHGAAGFPLPEAVVNELQTSNQELQASNEEVTSVNEDLQSTNEELETSKEELQSLNEELTTVNAQLQAKMDELEKTGNDLSSLLSSTDIAVIFLDPRLRIHRYTPAVKDLIDLIPADIGRPLTDLRRKFADPELIADARLVAENLAPVEREVASESGRWYVRRVLPYRTTDNRIDGIVVTFVDITARAQAEAALRDSEERFRAIVSQATVGVFYTDLAGRFTFANQRYYVITGYTPEELIGRPLCDITHPDDAARYRGQIDLLLAEGVPFEIELRHASSDGSVVWVHNSMTFVRPAGDAAPSCLGMAVDITALKQSEESLRRAHEELERQMVERTTALVAVNGALITEGLARDEAARIDLLRRLAYVQEAERLRIARELHDSLGQYLTAMTLGLRAVQDASRTGPPPADRLNQLFDLTKDIGQEVHRLAVELRPTSLDDLGLRAALLNYVEAWTLRTKVPVEFGSRGLDGERFAPQTSTAVYRVVQEALTNVLKHAGATRVSVYLERQPNHLFATVEDYGKGFDPDLSPDPARAVGGLGLLGMHERVALVGGTLEIESSPGGGTTVFVRVPLPPPTGTPAEADHG